MVMNHLYFSTADVMVTVPLSNVERVEVVYGPASVVYGANAFMGVIYVVTADAPADDGSHLTGF
jgi:iron complex outermembrane receptor protein